MFKLLRLRKRSPRVLVKAALGDFKLPSMRDSVLQVLSELRNLDGALTAVARKIEVDPAMNVRVLRMVNSAAFGLSKKVSNMNQAVSLIGRARLESLFLSMAVRESISPIDAHGFDEKRYWSNAFTRACLAKNIEHRFHPATSFEAFTAGLLQDIGVPILAQAKGEEYVNVYNIWVDDPFADLQEMEHEAFGLDHSEVGLMLAKEWELPQFLQDSIAYHHIHLDDGEIEQGNSINLVSMINEKDFPPRPSFFELAEQWYHIEKEEMEELIKIAKEEAIEFSSTLV